MKTRITVTRAGVDVKHEREFIINRPHGANDILFLHFLAPIHIYQNGRMTYEKAGACIFYLPPHRQWYSGIEEGFNHNWFHMSGTDSVKLLGRYNLPRNKVFYPYRTDFIGPLISEIKLERSMSEPHSEKAIAILVEHLVLLLARHLETAEDARLTPRRAELLARFKKLRAALHNAPEKPWTVEMMARETMLSASRFAVLYKDFFGVSPVINLLQARLSKASWLLTNTTLAIKDVAFQSGFENIYYFSRIFHRQIGCAPRDYYRKMVKKSILASQPSRRGISGQTIN